MAAFAMPLHIVTRFPRRKHQSSSLASARGAFKRGAAVPGSRIPPSSPGTAAPGDSILSIRLRGRTDDGPIFPVGAVDSRFPVWERSAVVSHLTWRHGAGATFTCPVLHRSGFSAVAPWRGMFGKQEDAAEQIRTADTWIFSPLLYHLSYSGVSREYSTPPELLSSRSGAPGARLSLERGARGR